MISIILPFFNKWEMTHSRLNEIYHHLSHHPIEVILVDDASTEDNYVGGVGWWQKSFNAFPVRYHRNVENLGFIGSMNAGAEIALKHNADVLIFLSNDVVISGDFVAEILAVLAQNDRVLIGGEIINYPAGWNEFIVNDKKVVLPWLGGWMLACTDVIWQSLGGFDPRYGISDFEDVDISTTALDLGYKLIPLNCKHLQHLVAESFGYNEMRLERTKHNREVYFQKWQDKLIDLQNRLPVLIP